MMPLNKTFLRETQIASAFQQGLKTIQSQNRLLLDELDETERRAKIAQVFEPFAHLIEAHTREELATDLEFVAIALAVAKAIVWAEMNPPQ